jgi:hypothetical protein
MTIKTKRMWGSSDTEAGAVFFAQLNSIRSALVAALAASMGDRVLSSVGGAIGGTDTSVSTVAFTYQIGAAAGKFNTFKAKGAVAAGTALAAGTIPINKWGVYLFAIAANGTISCTAGAANFTAGYDSEALALAAVPATPANEAAMLVVTVQTEVGSAFIGNTDALAGGASGNPANATNYYNVGANYASGGQTLADASITALEALELLE